MSKPNQQSPVSQAPSEEKSAGSSGVSQTRRPTIRQQQDALFRNALKLVDQQFEASRVIGEVETLRAENAKLRERNRFLAALVDLAAVWVADDTADAAEERAAK